MNVTEARLPDLVIDLFDQYGSSNARPTGEIINFQVIHANTTYLKAKAEIEALLTLHGLKASTLTITPGPEIKVKTNRSIKFSIAKGLLV